MKFQRFLRAARNNQRVVYDCDVMGEHVDVVREIYRNAEMMSNYYLDGRFQDMLIALTKSGEFEGQIFAEFMKAVKEKFDEAQEPIMLLIPLNFIVSEKFDGEIRLSDSMIIFPAEKSLVNVFPFDFPFYYRSNKKKKEKHNSLPTAIKR